MKSLALLSLYLCQGTPTSMALSSREIQENHDNCFTDAHCLNGGTCVKAEYNYCTCQDGFNGLRCERYCPLTCENGGYCQPKEDIIEDPHLASHEHQDPKNFLCKCRGYFTGPSCSVPYLNCQDGRRCLNGGTCPADVTLPCSCPPGFYGDLCDHIDLRYVPPPPVVAAEAETTAKPAYGRSIGIVLGLFGVAVVLGVVYRRLRVRYNAVPIHEEETVPTLEASSSNGRRWVNVV